MQPTKPRSFVEQVVTPKAVDRSTLILKGPSCAPIAFRALSTSSMQPLTIQKHEVALRVALDDQVQTVALSIQDLAQQLKLSPKEITQAYEAGRLEGLVNKQHVITDIEEKFKGSDSPQERDVFQNSLLLLRKGLDPQEIDEIQTVSQRMFQQLPPEQTALMVEVPKTPERGCRAFVLVSKQDPSSAPEFLLRIKSLGEGGTARSSLMLNLKTLEQTAVKLPLSGPNIQRNSALVEQEARLLMTIAQELKQKGLSHVGIQLPPHRVCCVRSVNSETGIPGEQKPAFLGRIYEGTLQDSFPPLAALQPGEIYASTLLPKKKDEVARQLTQGLFLLHTVLGRVHGDIKHENVFFEKNNFYLADLSDGKTVQEQEAIYKEFLLTEKISEDKELCFKRLSGVSTFLTYEDQAMCTRALEIGDMPLYHRVRQASDVYALGVVLLGLYVKDAWFLTDPEIFDRLDEIKNNLQHPHFLGESGVSPQRMDILARMLDGDWQKRPKADEIQKAFL